MVVGGSMEVMFRVASFDDVEGIITLCNECFNETTDINLAKERYKLTEDDRNQIYIVGEIENKIVAHARIQIIKTIYDDMGIYAILNHVCVKPDYRRHNLATKMLEYIEKVCLEKQCNSIKLWSRNFRIPAHECYKKFGFTPDDSTFFYKMVDEGCSYEYR